MMIKRPLTARPGRNRAGRRRPPVVAGHGCHGGRPATSPLRSLQPRSRRPVAACVLLSWSTASTRMRSSHGGSDHIRVMFPEVAQDRHVMIPTKPSARRPIVGCLEVGELRRHRRAGEIMQPAFGHRLQLLERSPRRRTAGPMPRRRTPSSRNRRRGGETRRRPGRHRHTRSGRSAASSSTTLPPHDWPTTTTGERNV